MHGVLLVFVLIVIAVAVTAFKQGIRMYGMKKRRDGTAGFWTQPLIPSRHIERDGQ
jgi:hypothetical protein